MARLKHSAIGLACLVACGSALADPFSLIATAIVYGAGLTGAAAFATFAAASLLGMASQRRKQRRAAAAAKAEYNANLSDRTVTILNTEAPHQIVYGSPPPFAGAVVADMISGDRDQYHHQIYVFAAHSLTSIDAIYIDGIDIGPLDAAGWATTGDFTEQKLDVVNGRFDVDSGGNYALAGVHVTRVITASYGGPENSSGLIMTVSYDAGTNTSTFHTDYVAETTVDVSYETTTTLSRLNVSQHLSPGGVDTADGYFISVCGGKWTPDHKLSGYSYLAVTTDLTLSRFQNGPPAVTIKAKGKAVYDFRTGVTAYSANPILCRADFIMSEQGWGASTGQFDTAALIAAANACDAAAYTPSDQTANTAVLYSCDGVFRTDQDRDTTLQQLEDCCAGNTHESGGVWRLMAGFWETPVMALTDADLHGPLVVQQASYTSKERFNGARGQYCDWRNSGVAGDFTPYVNPTFLADDATARNADLSLPFTHSHQRAIQLARVAVEKSRGGLVISYPAHMRCWPLQPGDRVTVTNAEYGFSAKNFRVSDWLFNLNSPVGLELIEDEASFYDLADEASVDAAPNSNLPDPFAKPEAPANLRADSGTAYLVAQGNTFLPRVFVAWDAPYNFAVTQGGSVVLRWITAGDPEATWQTKVLRGDATSEFIEGRTEGDRIVVQVYFVTAVHAAGAPSSIAHVVVGKTEPPTAPSAVAATPEAVVFALSPDIDVAGYRISYSVGSSTQVSTSTMLHAVGADNRSGLVLSSPWPLPVRLYGINTVFVVAVDTSGNESVAAYDVQDFGQPDAANIADLVQYDPTFPGFITNGAVVAGDIVADSDPAVDIYGAGSGADIYYRDGAADIYGGSQYLALSYVASYASPYAGGTILLDFAGAGSRTAIEYRTDGGGGDVYSGHTDIYSGYASVYGDEQSWKPWNGALTPTVAHLGLQFRITVDAGSVQGVIDSLAIRTEMPTLEQTFGGVTISAAGTTLAPSAGFPARTWIAIEDVQVTPADANSVGGRVKTYPVDPATGPVVELLNSSATPVTAVAFVRIQGY